jgi:5'-nucleotidase / UDP-sugar diphosphatase
MRPARSVRSLSTGPLIACAALSLGLVAGCGGGTAAQPTPTAAAPAASTIASLPSPTRPQLASPSPSPASSTGSPSAVASPVAGEQEYEVQSGDTLLSIAEQFYGDATRWRPIYDANKDTIGADPDKLKLGMKLKIPPKES